MVIECIADVSKVDDAWTKMVVANTPVPSLPKFIQFILQYTIPLSAKDDSEGRPAGSQNAKARCLRSGLVQEEATV